MTRDFAHIVLGVGAIGAATAYRVARRRGAVLAIEQYELGHGMGASEDHSRIIRHAYHSTDYTALTAQAYAAWGEIEERTGLTLVTRTGGVDIGVGAAGEAMAASYQRALEAAAHPSTVLDAATLRARQPQWRVPDDVVAVYQAESGILDIRKANAAHVALARQEGATFLERTRVERIESLPDRVLVTTDQGSFSADTLSVCAGSWTPTALHGLDVRVPLTLTHEQVTYWATRNLRAFAPDRFGVWIYHEGETTYYGFPVYGEAATKAGRDVSGKVVTQETRSWDPDEDNRADLTRSTRSATTARPSPTPTIPPTSPSSRRPAPPPRSRDGEGHEHDQHAASTAAHLPGRYYTEQDIFDVEQERIFSREWVYAAHVSELGGAGDVVRRQIGPESVLIVRGQDGGLRGFLNVCRHRGSAVCLAERANVGRALRCPYHSWTYHLDGALRSAPNMRTMEGLDRAAYGLVPVATAVWQGLVWVNLDPDADPLLDQLEPQLEYRLGTSASRLDRYRIGDLVPGFRREYTVAANWKIIQENFQECYHCSTIHPELIRQIPSFRSFEELGAGDYFRGGYAFDSERDGFSLTGRSTHATLPDLAPDDQRLYFGMVLRPNCFLSLLPDHVIVHRFTALDPERTAVTCDWLFAADTVAAPDFDPADTVELFHRVNEQDFAASEWCQPNMRSRGYRDGGALVPLEATIIGNWYYPWYRARVGLPHPDV